MFGYQGNFLEVNLDTRETKNLPLNEEQLKNFIGGLVLLFDNDAFFFRALLT